MAKLSLEELRKFRDSESLRLRRRSIHGRNVHVVVCMGTCGIAAGAKIVLNTIVDELEAKGLDNVIVTQTGCAGDCADEPIVEVHTPELGSVAYGKVDQKTAKRIVDEHIIGGSIVADHRIELEV
ncbi:MAG: (2Fe-2S) ferredoxin domain-containing protein [Bullifex sp.]|nr:(2Fe-2S) ferredoxin domain-containing protein [Bullifex sp.]